MCLLFFSPLNEGHEVREVSRNTSDVHCVMEQDWEDLTEVGTSVHQIISNRRAMLQMSS